MFERLRAFLGVLASAPKGTRPVVVEADGRILGACIFVERNAVVAGETSCADQLVSQWNREVPGVVARADLAVAWAKGWAKKRRVQAQLTVSQRIYRLERVTDPKVVRCAWPRAWSN